MKYKGVRIYQLNCEKKIQIHMFSKNVGIVEIGDTNEIANFIEKEMKKIKNEQNN